MKSWALSMDVIRSGVMGFAEWRHLLSQCFGEAVQLLRIGHRTAAGSDPSFVMIEPEFFATW